MEIKLKLYSSLNQAVCAIKEGDLNSLKSIASSIPEDKVAEMLSKQDKNGETCLVQAIYKKDVPIVKYLLEVCHVDPMVTDVEIGYSLNVAAKSGQLEIVEALLGSGAKSYYRDEFDDINCSANVAFEAGHPEIGRYLIENGEKIDETKYLIDSFHIMHDDLIKFLLGREVDFNVEGEFKDTIHYYCCELEKIKIIKTIVGKGVNHRMRYLGATAIQSAALHRKESVIRFYCDKKYYTKEELCDAFDLLGVGSMLARDLPSAVSFWNKALDDRPEAVDFKSNFLGAFQRNAKQFSNYDHLVGDLENASIHSMLILERIFGIGNFRFRHHFADLSDMISILNIQFWEASLYLTFDYDILCSTHYYFTNKFQAYIEGLHYKNINTSVLKVFCGFLNGRLDKQFLKNDIEKYYDHQTFIQDVVCLYSLKETLVDSDTGWFRMIMKNVLYSKNFSLNEAILRGLIQQELSWDLPYTMIIQAFEFCCKMSESVNYLNNSMRSPLNTALGNYGNDEFVNILLECGALTDTRDSSNQSIREHAIKAGRLDICLGATSLQCQINTSLKKAEIECTEEKPEIMKYFIIFH